MDLRASLQLPPPAQDVTVGGYQVLGRLAIGGMSELFLAQECIDGEAIRFVVIKLLPADHPARPIAPDAERLFLREGRTLLRLDHPNICHSYAFGNAGPRRYIAMEWIDGVSLRGLMRALPSHGRLLPFPLVANLIAQVAAGLHHAHTVRDARNTPLRLVHRDVSPTNIMIRYDGVVKLIDFGVAQVVEHQVEALSSAVRGKLAYMAPEQMRDDDVDHRADLFALGVCMYELLTGIRLYRRESERATADAVLYGDVPSARKARPKVPEALDEIVQRALQKSPVDRFEDAAAMQTALEEYLIDVGEAMGPRKLGAMMDSLFPGRGRAPEIEPEVDVAERISDPGPLPSPAGILREPLSVAQGAVSGPIPSSVTAVVDGTPLPVAVQAPSHRPVARAKRRLRGWLLAAGLLGGLAAAIALRVPARRSVVLLPSLRGVQAVPLPVTGPLGPVSVSSARPEPDGSGASLQPRLPGVLGAMPAAAVAPRRPVDADDAAISAPKLPRKGPKASTAGFIEDPGF
jgi:serine/threonine-protein kinase